MRALLLATAAILCVSHARAETDPTRTPKGKGDGRVCSVPYNPNEVTRVEGAFGETVTLLFPSRETVHVAASDKENLSIVHEQDLPNMLYLKSHDPKGTIALPISITSSIVDGSPRTYIILWSAYPLEPAVPNLARLASADGNVVAPDPMPEARHSPCFLVKFINQDDERAEAAAKAKIAAMTYKEAAVEKLLRNDQVNTSSINTDYEGQGDADIGPADRPGCALGIKTECSVYDDGMTTFLNFPGNIPIPTFYTVNKDGSDGASIDTTIEDNGRIKLNAVYPEFRMRHDEKTLCVWSKRFDRVGNNPETGTTSRNIARTPRR